MSSLTTAGQSWRQLCYAVLIILLLVIGLWWLLDSKSQFTFHLVTISNMLSTNCVGMTCVYSRHLMLPSHIDFKFLQHSFFPSLLHVSEHD